MDGAGTQIAQSFVMRFCTVSFMDLEAVAGVLRSHSLHVIITGHLGQHGSSSDIGAAAIAFDHGFYIYTKILLSIAVDQSKVRPNF